MASGPTGSDTLAAPGGGWLITRPSRILLALDMAGVALMVAAVAQLADPDILLHVVWIVLALEAFTFGLRPASIRIAGATIFVLAYAFFANDAMTPVGLALADLDLEEWPLMAVIALLVAIMADKVTSTGRRYAALYREASDRLLTAQEDERRRLSADLHDGVGQTMTALSLALDAAEAELEAEGVPDAAGRRSVRRAHELAGIALDEARGVAFRLRPPRLREVGLVAAIEELAATAGVPVEFSASPSLMRHGLLAADREVEAFRIVQEALGNATRHAHAERIRVDVSQVGQTLRVEVADDGDGFEPSRVGAGGLGLASMDERAKAVRGTLQVRSRLGTGTIVRLDVPLATGQPAGATGSLGVSPGATTP